MEEARLEGMDLAEVIEAARVADMGFLEAARVVEDLGGDLAASSAEGMDRGGCLARATCGT